MQLNTVSTGAVTVGQRISWAERSVKNKGYDP